MLKSNEIPWKIKYWVKPSKNYFVFFSEMGLEYRLIFFTFVNVWQDIFKSCNNQKSASQISRMP